MMKLIQKFFKLFKKDKVYDFPIDIRLTTYMLDNGDVKVIMSHDFGDSILYQKYINGVLKSAKVFVGKTGEIIPDMEIDDGHTNLSLETLGYANNLSLMSRVMVPWLTQKHSRIMDNGSC